MADFALWEKETLVKYAQDATDEIARLQEDLRNMHIAWRQALHATIAPATVPGDYPVPYESLFPSKEHSSPQDERLDASDSGGDLRRTLPY